MNNNQIEIKKYITPDIKKKMTTWEKEFITSLYNRKEPWTSKQVDVFNNIKKKYKLNERKVVEKIIYLPEGYDSSKKIQTITTRKMRRHRGIARNSQ